MKVGYKYALANQTQSGNNSGGINYQTAILGFYKTRKEAIDAAPQLLRSGYKEIFLYEANVALKVKNEPVIEEGLE